MNVKDHMAILQRVELLKQNLGLSPYFSFYFLSSATETRAGLSKNEHSLSVWHLLIPVMNKPGRLLCSILNVFTWSSFLAALPQQEQYGILLDLSN